MDKQDRKANEVLIMRLKSGEYDGTHIMKAWLTIQAQDERIAELEKENNALKDWVVTLEQANRTGGEE